jgi:hypothetical protein
VRGGATASAGSTGWLTVSWPLVSMAIEDNVLKLMVRSRFGRAMMLLTSLGKVGRTMVENVWWQCPVEDISQVLLAGRSVVARSKKSGDFRFVAMDGQALHEILKSSNELSDRIEIMTGTFFRSLGMSGPTG